MHLYDPHDPYDPPEPFKTKYRAAPYDGEIAYADFAVGKLLAVLHARGLYDSTVIAVAADHGEAFGEHGELTHGIFLYDETIHVPLLVKFAGASQAASRIDTRVGLVDLAPTILQAVGITPPAGMQGESLMELAKPDSKPRLRTIRRTPKPTIPIGLSAGVRYEPGGQGKYLYVEAPQRELYDQGVGSRSLTVI